jgi:hypothetical protein
LAFSLHFLLASKKVQATQKLIPGTDVMISKIVLPKNGEKIGVLTQNTAKIGL